ncbi:MAG TPA: 50S ribosomal protein L3 [Candidatus Binataceae bacterium]|nr:50S ribosomal protein L3 [Candidatus Binataceae bacterium]HZY58219.1 50S ribosomal protein L3 [Candidatus Binataceae bacterium]
MLSGLIGKKLGMTAFADASGALRAATVVALGPCQVTQVKTAATDGYEAIQVTFGRKKHSRVRAPQRGHFAKSETAPGLATREFRAADSAEIKLGQAVGVGDVFKPGDMVDVAGVSKGRGYAGVIKRHHFSGFPGSHGTHEYFRHGGSIGNRSYPGRVFKGLRMAGQMGNEAVTVPNLEVLQVLPEDHAIVIAGALPGAKGGIVIVRHAAKHRRTEAERGAANA